jgi:hypothetical protein
MTMHHGEGEGSHQHVPATGGATPADQTTAPGGHATAAVTPEALAEAMRQVRREQGRTKVRRRVLLGVLAAGACAATVELGPAAVRQAGLYTEADLKQALDAGIQAGRQAVMSELTQLEGIPLTGAIGVAELTRFGVNTFVVPLAQLAVTITGDALDVLDNAVSSARSNLARFNISIAWLDSLQTLISTWHASLPDPQQLSVYANADISSAEAYLKALRAKIAAEQNGTPTASPTTTP